MKVLGGPASQLLGSRVAREIGCELAIVEFKQFPDGELYLRIAEELDGDTLIVQSTTTNNDIIYLLQLIDAASDGYLSCLLYTSDAADDLTRVDLGGRRIIKKKNNKKN